MAGRKIAERHADKPVVRTGGEVFPDGSMVELIRIPDAELNLLVWNGKAAKTAKQFAWHDETFAPLCIDRTIMCSLQLPSNIAKYGSTRKLFTEISGLISLATRLEDRVVRILTFFVFATWLTDSLPVAPFLWIVTPATTTTALLLQLLRLLCRRALVVNDISSVGFQSLPMELQPTLLMELFQPTRRVLTLLRATTRHGAFFGARGEAMDFYCAKIVFPREPLRDPASVGFPLELVLSPTRDYVPLMGSSESKRIAAEYQAKLLHYRLVNRAEVHTPSFDLSQFTGPMQEVAYSLAAPISSSTQCLLLSLGTSTCTFCVSMVPWST